MIIAVDDAARMLLAIPCEPFLPCAWVLPSCTLGDAHADRAHGNAGRGDAGRGEPGRARAESGRARGESIRGAR